MSVAPELDCIAVSDVLTYLSTLPDACVNLIVTSPPYFGLRDYGTASWDGGDPACDHAVGNQVQDNKAPGAISTGVRPGVDASVCKKCGARRIDQQIGLEATPAAYIDRLVAVFREAKRVLRDDGNVYVNLGDSYASKPVGRFNGGGFKDGSIGRDMSGVESSGKMDKVAASGLPEKSLIGIPWRFAIAMQDDGWLLREDIVWAKGNPMPESVKDRCTRAHEYIFHFTKRPRYWSDMKAVAQNTADVSLARAKRGVSTANKNVTGAPGQSRQSVHRPREHGDGYPLKTTRNLWSVWPINTASFKGAHFAVYPEKLVSRIIAMSCPEEGVVLDPFMGTGTTAAVAKKMNRKFLGCDLNPEYVAIANRRLDGIPYPMFSTMKERD